ncbi:MAG: M56 family metallopeptidase [Singulisphaera sp.]
MNLAWVQLWQVAAAAILVGAVTRFFCERRPRLAYALWMLVVVKAIVPPVWSSPTGLFSWALAAIETRQDGPTVKPFEMATTSDPVASGTKGVVAKARNVAAAVGNVVDRPKDKSVFALIAFCLWLVGLLVGVVCVLSQQIRSAILVRRSSLLPDESYPAVVLDLSSRLGIRPKVGLLITSNPIGPAALGLLRPKIVLPMQLLSGMQKDHAELVLAHELIHIRRRDVLASKVQLAALLLWWFNPLIWWVSQRVSHERERCCDEEVIAGLGCAPVRYARALLSVLEQRENLRSIFALPGVRAFEINSQRLEAVMRYDKTDQRRVNHIARVAFLVGLLLLMPGTGLTLSPSLRAEDHEGASPSDAAINSEPEGQMEGKWSIVHCEFSGQTEAGIIGVKQTIQNGKWLRPGRRTGEYRLKLDTSKNPTWVDLSADRLGEQTLKGICVLAGDKLTICYAYKPELPRPTEFKTATGVPGYLYVLERAKEAGANPTNNGNASISSSAADLPPLLEKLQGKWKVTGCEFSGKNESQAAGIFDAISGNQWLRPNRRTATYRLLNLDESKSPIWVNLSADRLGSQTLKGILSLDGDKLTICYSYRPDLPRPTDFKTELGTPAYKYVLERVVR